MLDQVLANRDTVQELGITGSQVDAFAAHLVACGYASTTVRSQLRLLGEFNRWLIRHRCGVRELDNELVDTFVKGSKRHGRVHRGHAATLHQFLAHLRARGELAASAPVVDQSPIGQLQRAYAQYLTTERGLAPVTVADYVDVLRRFLTDRFANGPVELGTLDVSTITTFVIRRARTMSPRYAQGMVTALRSICRFLQQRGAIDRDLAAGLPSVSDWRLATIPKYLNPEEVERVLQTCDRQTAAGRRDHAILLLLARLGLRAGEIIASRTRRHSVACRRDPRPQQQAAATGPTPLGGRDRRGARHLSPSGSPVTHDAARVSLYESATARLRQSQHGECDCATCAGAGRDCRRHSKEPICFATVWRPECCGTAPRFQRSAWCCGIGRCRRRRSTPRSISTACAR